MVPYSMTFSDLESHFSTVVTLCAQLMCDLLAILKSYLLSKLQCLLNIMFTKHCSDAKAQHFLCCKV